MTTHHIEDITKKNIESISVLERDSTACRSLGEAVADQVAAWVGSWTFLIVQGALLCVWVAINAWKLTGKWDPYPFVLLNLVLSFEAAFATPIILMSQNRQTRITERRHQLDLQINLLAEQENTEQLRLLRLVCDRIGIDCTATVFEEAVTPETVMKQIVATENNGKPLA